MHENVCNQVEVVWTLPKVSVSLCSHACELLLEITGATPNISVKSYSFFFFFFLSVASPDAFETSSGVTLLFNEPPDARKPDTRWRLYVFKGGEVLNGKSLLDTIVITISVRCQIDLHIL